MNPTIRQLLNDLPEPYRSKALDNEYLKRNDWDLPFNESKEFVLLYAFKWAKTSELDEYWAKVSMNLKSGEIQLKPLAIKIIERALSLGLECEIIYTGDFHYKITNNLDDIAYEDIKTIKFKKK